MISQPDIRRLAVDASGPRLDAFLAAGCPDLSRTRLQDLIRAGHVLLNGNPAKPSCHPKTGDVVEIRVPPVQPAAIQAEALPIAVVFEDEDFLAIDKPPGLVTHPAPGHASGTMVNALLHHCRGRLSGIGGIERPGIVHRLDKDTSGLMIVAKNDAAHRELSRQFAGREVRKTYLALVAGGPPRDSGRIEQPIARHPRHRQRMAVVPGGRPAITLYRVVEIFPDASLVECVILTGRTHQIRVHLQWLKCPVLGDATYGRAGGRAPRQMLHAWKIAFRHPRTGSPLELTAPLTSDFQHLLNELRHEP